MDMKKAKSQLPAVIRTKSVPLKNFEDNLDQVMAFIKRMSADDLVWTLKKVKRSNVKALASSPINLKRVAKNMETVSAKVAGWLEFYRPAARWVVVMLISFLEGFMEDILVEIALKNPKIVKGDEVPVRAIVTANSLEELKRDVRRNWAHDALRPNGPEKWRRTLSDLGAPTIDQKAIAETQYLWDTRNLIVHSRCIADKTYAIKYANRGAKFGVEVNVNMHFLKTTLPYLRVLVEWADTFLTKYPVKTK
jgi:hypothetical protein